MIIDNKNWPIPCHSSEKDKIKGILDAGGKVQLTYGVSIKGDVFVAEINPKHEERRKEVESDGKQKL